MSALHDSCSSRVRSVGTGKMMIFSATSISNTSIVTASIAKNLTLVLKKTKMTAKEKMKVSS